MSQNQIDTNDLPAVPVGKTKIFYGIVLLYCLYALDVAARYGLLAVFPDMQVELNLSDSQIGFIGAIISVGMSVFVLPFAFMADKLSKKYVLTFMGSLWGVGCLLCGFASNFASIVIGRLAVGAGVSSYAPVSVASFTSWIKKSRWGTTIGIYNSSLPIGMAAGSVITGVLASQYGWRVPFIVIGVISLVFALLALLTLPPTENTKAHENKTITVKKNVTLKEASKVTFKNKTLIIFSIAAGLSNLGLSTMVTWIPMYLVRSLGWTVAEVGATMGIVYLLMGVVMTPLGGFLIDLSARKSRRMRIWFAVPLFVIMAIVNVIAVQKGLFAFLVAYMFIANIPYVGFHTATQELVPARYKTSAYGTYVILLQSLGFFGPLLVGFFSEKFGLDTALIYIQIFYILAAIFAFIAGLFYMKDYEIGRALEEQENQ